MTRGCRLIAVLLRTTRSSVSVRARSFIQKPRVLDRDHGLVGEGRRKLDLLCPGMVPLHAGERKGHRSSFLAQQRYAKFRGI
jgi:hypothetical protein